MKAWWALALVLAGVMGCQTTNIGMNKAALQSMKTLAVLPFEAEAGLDPQAALEAQEAVKTALLQLGFKMVEREKLVDLMKEAEFSAADSATLQKVSELTGADGLVFGRVLQNRAYRTTVTETQPHSLLAEGLPPPPVTYETDAYAFQVQLRISSVTTGQVVLTLKNTWANHVNDRKFMAIPSLEAFRGQVLDQIAHDLQDAYLKK